MILIGQYDSPFVRRVAIAMRLYGLSFEQRPWSVFGDAEKIAQYNPLMRVPTLVMGNGEVLIESGAILDHLDESVGPDRALLPQSGAPRRAALRRIALMTGAADKAAVVAAAAGRLGTERELDLHPLDRDRVVRAELAGIIADGAIDSPERLHGRARLRGHAEVQGVPVPNDGLQGRPLVQGGRWVAGAADVVALHACAGLVPVPQRELGTVRVDLGLPGRQAPADAAADHVVRAAKLERRRVIYPTAIEAPLGAADRDHVLGQHGARPIAAHIGVRAEARPGVLSAHGPLGDISGVRARGAGTGHPELGVERLTEREGEDEALARYDLRAVIGSDLKEPLRGRERSHAVVVIGQLFHRGIQVGRAGAHPPTGRRGRAIAAPWRSRVIQTPHHGAGNLTPEGQGGVQVTHPANPDFFLVSVGPRDRRIAAAQQGSGKGESGSVLEEGHLNLLVHLDGRAEVAPTQGIDCFIHPGTQGTKSSSVPAQ